MMFISSLATCITTFFYSGKSPKAPGTMGSLATVLVFWLVAYMLGVSVGDLAGRTGQMSIVLVIFYGISVWAGKIYQQTTKQHDPKEMVSDEVVGQLLSYALAMFLIKMLDIPQTDYFNETLLLVGFISFRLFDITKPSIVGWADRTIHSVHGVMLDDVFAGIFAGITTALFFILRIYI